MTTKYQVAFWNLENLIDIENSPHRTEKLERALGKENALKGRDQVLVDRKIDQLASIIKKMNEAAGPDILGVCEVENEHLMNLLCAAVAIPGRNYAIRHHNSKDERGIDVAFIYDRNKFTVEPEKVFDHFVMRRTGTRDIVQVGFLTNHGNRLVLMANHWPSRSGGRYESAAYRAVAGETLAYFHARTMEMDGSDTPVMAMGDFNDEPFDTSIVDFALAKRLELKVLKADEAPRLLDLMWKFAPEGIGSYYYQNWPNLLDQFLVNAPMLRPESPIHVLKDTVDILRLPEMVADGAYPCPRPFGSMGKKVDLDGYSDHFPITVNVEEVHT
jgi:predicted extracellular nuclease